MSCARPPLPRPAPSHRDGALEQRLCSGPARGQRAGPGPLSPGGGEGSLTKEAGQDPHVCRVRVGTGWKRTGAGAGRRGRRTREGGERLPEAPWTRGGAGGGWTLCRRKKGCRGGSRGQEQGGEGAGQLLRPGEEGGGGREGGCPTADTHTGDSRLARSAALREAWGAAGCRGGSRQGRPPICLFSYPTRVACRKQRALRVGSHQLPGLGTWCSKRTCGQTPGRTSWTGKGDRETPFPLVDLRAEVISPLGVSR